MNSISLVIKLCVAAAGLTLPGDAVGRMLGVRLGRALAFPLSALLLTELVMVFSGLGVPLQIWTMGPALAGLTLICYWLSCHKTPYSFDTIPEDVMDAMPALKTCALVLAGLIVLVVTVRTTLYPLSGYDTFWRWDALARAMLSNESLHFYPPVTADDYGKYFFTDGIPPLVSTVYWWLYAVMGRPVEQVTSLSVMLQLVSTMALTFFGTRFISGSRIAAYSALVVLCTTTLLLDGFAIGQETGFLALSVAGQLCFAWAAVRKPAVSPVVASALFAAVGALSRDYAPALALIGISVLLCNRQTRRLLPVFIMVTATLSAPWYVRSWILTGNPLYSHGVFPGFRVNAVHVALMNSYKEFNSLSQITLSDWQGVLSMLATTAPLAIFVGLPLALSRWRTTPPLIISTALIVFLWLWSVPQTNVGIFYSLRALCPVFIVLSIAAGLAVGPLSAHVSRFGPWSQFTAMAVGGLLSLYAVIDTAAYPYPPREIRSAFISRHTGTPEICANQILMADNLNASGALATGLLTDDPYFAILLSRNSRFRPVMIWSPEVAYIFDPSIGMAEILRRLRAQNITLVELDDSPNNLFLSRNRFFSDEVPRWKQVSNIADQLVVYSLPPR